MFQTEYKFLKFLLTEFFANVISRELINSIIIDMIIRK